MDLDNRTKQVVGCTTATDKKGREWLVIACKGSYGFPDRRDAEPRLLAEQVPLTTTDMIAGEPEAALLVSENDFAPHKPRCDVLLNGSCHAPEGQAVQHVEVSMKVGPISKSFRVIGSRIYEAGVFTLKPSDPRPFTVLPITYANAYGGIDRTPEDKSQHQWYPFNPAGLGYYPKTSGEALHGKPLPNTEEIDEPVTRPNGRYKPMAFGPIGRAWRQRIGWAGTYDQQWLNEHYPFLPQDFDPRYFQSAPEDQQMDYPRGGEPVALTNLTPQGFTTFRLPKNLALPVVLVTRDQAMTEVAAVVDTIVLEPDLQRFSLVWRCAYALRRNVHEVKQVVIGQTVREIQRLQAREERLRSKPYFKSLAELIEWSRGEPPPDDTDVEEDDN